jgi:hypothetical protein
MTAVKRAGVGDADPLLKKTTTNGPSDSTSQIAPQAFDFHPLAELQRTTQEWANRIRSAWQSSLMGIFKCGALLIEAKEALDHGAFLKMIECELPFKRSTAQALMRIARDERITKSNTLVFCRHIGAR